MSFFSMTGKLSAFGIQPAIRTAGKHSAKDKKNNLAGCCSLTAESFMPRLPHGGQVSQKSGCVF